MQGETTWALQVATTVMEAKEGNKRSKYEGMLEFQPCQNKDFINNLLLIPAPAF